MKHLHQALALFHLSCKLRRNLAELLALHLFRQISQIQPAQVTCMVSIWVLRYFAVVSRQANSATAPHIKAMPVSRWRRWCARSVALVFVLGMADELNGFAIRQVIYMCLRGSQQPPRQMDRHPSAARLMFGSEQWTARSSISQSFSVQLSRRRLSPVWPALRSDWWPRRPGFIS